MAHPIAARPARQFRLRRHRRIRESCGIVLPATENAPRPRWRMASALATTCPISSLENSEGEAILRPSRRMDCFRIVSRERASQKAYTCFGAIFDPSRCRSLRRLTSGAIVRRRPLLALRGINSVIGGGVGSLLALRQRARNRTGASRRPPLWPVLRTGSAADLRW